MEGAEGFESVMGNTNTIGVEKDDLGFQVSTCSSSPRNIDSDSVVGDPDLSFSEKLELLSDEIQRLELVVECGENENDDLIDGDRDGDDHRVVIVDEEEVKKSTNENEGELKFDKDGWSDDRSFGNDVKKSESEKVGRSCDRVDEGELKVDNDGWGSDHGDGSDMKKSEGEKDGWNDYRIYDDVNVESKENGNYGWNDYGHGDNDMYLENDNVGYISATPLTEEGEQNGRFQYPLRPNTEDCSFYIRTRTCKFGPNCKFNHPVVKKYQGVKEKMNAREGSSEHPGQIECKYYLSPGGCKYGKDCRYSHSRGTTTPALVLDFNFVGLPIRPGEQECPYYMRTGSCKYAANCRFNHPNPAPGSESPSGYGNGETHSLQGGGSQPNVAPLFSPRPLRKSSPCVPIMFPSAQGISTQNKEWNGYQAPTYSTDMNMRPSAAYAMNNSASETNVLQHYPHQMLVVDFPERPGQPECSYFLKTGDCKYRSNCKFHHPKSRIINSTPCAVTEKGLPLRPDQTICTHYSRYGICKFGPNCKFDHPTNIGTSAISEADQTIVGARFSGSNAVM